MLPRRLTVVSLTLALAVGLAAPTAFAQSGAPADPSAEWSEPMGGPTPVDDTEAAEEAYLDAEADDAELEPSASGPVVKIDGAGWGHGVGMSQYGSYGRVRYGGQNYRQILADYYPGTTLVQDSISAPLWVNLKTELAKVVLKVQKNRSSAVPVKVTRADTSEQITLQPGATLTVEYLDRSGSGQPYGNPHRCRFSTAGFTSKNGSCVIDLEWDGWNGNPSTRIEIDKQWYEGTGSSGNDCVHRIWPATIDCAYARGEMHIRPDDFDESSDFGFNLVQEIWTDDYVRGIGEMPYNWPQDALKVQAVAARTYARHLQATRDDPDERQWCWCDLYDRSPDQVYLGWGFDEKDVYGIYAPNWVAASDATAGEVVKWGGKYIHANFAASNGGATENIEDVWLGSTPVPYLVSFPDPQDLNPQNARRAWTKEVPISEFAADTGFDTVTDVTILERYESGTPSDIAVTGVKNGVVKTNHFRARDFARFFSLHASRIFSVSLPDTQIDVDRWWGADRYRTAVEISRNAFAGGADNVFIATGTNFPDALAAAPLAHQRGGPILLATPSTLPAATKAEIQRLGAKRIYVLGGPVAVSNAVVARLEALAPVTRIWGSDRYATAEAISKVAFPSGADVAYVAVGTNFPDALAGAVLAAKRQGPMLLTARGSLSAVTRRELDRLDPQTIVVLGGGTAVSGNVVAQLKQLAPTVQSIAGPTRYATAVSISRHGFAGGAGTAFIATGLNFPDALAVGPAAAATGGPVLLVPTSSLPVSVADELDRLDPSRVVIVGGTAAVAGSVEAAIKAHLGG